MTTTILAQKLVSVKLNKGEFEKIKYMKSVNIEKTYKTFSTLKEILDKQCHNKACRLCLKVGHNKIFDIKEFDVVHCMKTLLQIYVTENDGKPQHLCKACEAVLRNADQLRQTAQVTEWRLQQELELLKQLPEDCGIKSVKHHGSYFVEQGSKVKREWACGKCRKTFDRQDEFTEHEGLPTCRGRRKSFICETCGMELKNINRLKTHMVTHSDKLDYRCEHCPYRGRTKYALCAHLQRHSGTKPFTCSECNASFYNSSNLASHKRTHLPPSHPCQFCDKSFKFKQALQNHLASHSSAKPHICNACGQTFSTRKEMCRHERKIHNRPILRTRVMPVHPQQQQEELT